MAEPKKLKILIAPLDWGLGHATRCIPIITRLLAAGCEVIIAAAGKQKLLLENEFPLLKLIELPGYKIRYGKKSSGTLLKIIFQIPKILIQINRENRWLNNILSRERFDAVISDNRYGLHAVGLYSVFITHQLHIKTPFGKIAERILSIINYKYINQFSICWIPDFENGYSVAGQLSQVEKLPSIPTRYIGPQTRLSKSAKTTILYDLLIIISGPEPQRSLFENKLFEQLKDFKGSAVVLRGLPEKTSLPTLPANIIVYNHLSTDSFNQVMNESEFVIGRSGYSTIMDIVALGKKSILIPTPGQPEQEYLAEYLFNKKIILRARQEDFVLEACLKEATQFSFIKYDRQDKELLETAISELLHAINL